jgi:FtsP/CotA-like multicopper oxidase with cupredoxin domain
MLLSPGASAPIVIEAGGGDVVIATLKYEPAPGRPAPRSDLRPLPDNPLPERIDFRGALKLDVPIEGGGDSAFTLAGRAGGPFGAPLFSVKRGRAAMLAFINRTEWAHSLHPHGHHFRLLDRLDDGWKPFWLDTLLVPSQQSVRIAFVADNPGKWLIEGCGIDHPDAGTATWFEVT